MPTLPLPPLGPGVSIDAGDLPVTDLDDVQAVWSPDITQLPSASAFLAVQKGQTNSLLTYQDLTRYAAAQSDPLRATDEYLDECGWERQVYRAAGEQDPPYSARVNARPATVDPNDIIAAANSVLAPYTAISCRYAEHTDGIFASNPSTTSWSNHAFNDGRLSTPGWTAMDPNYGGGPFATPNYPDRYYGAIPLRRPQGMIAFNAGGRIFVLRTPDVSFVDTTVLAAYQPAPTERTTLTLTVGTSATAILVQSVAGMGDSSGGPPAFISVDLEIMAVTAIVGSIEFVVVRGANGTTPANHLAGAVVSPAPPPSDPTTGAGIADGSYGIFPGNPADGVSAKAIAFAWSYDQTTAGIYQSVVNAVESIRGHSIRWSLLSDPNLI